MYSWVKYCLWFIWSLKLCLEHHPSWHMCPSCPSRYLEQNTILLGMEQELPIRNWVGGLTIKDSDRKTKFKCFWNILLLFWGLSSSCSVWFRESSGEAQGEKGRVCPLVCWGWSFIPSLNLKCGQALYCRPWKLSFISGSPKQIASFKTWSTWPWEGMWLSEFFGEGLFYCFQVWSRGSLTDC